MLISQERCIGCDCCTIACQIENNTSMRWIKVITEGSGQKDVPTGTFPNLEMKFMPLLCNHCEEPPCAEVCPEEAISKQEEGPVILDQNLCSGCQSCVSTCPYGAISFNDDTNIAEKCNLCFHRIEKGENPFCCVCCEGQAIFFGDLNDPESKISKKLNECNAFQLKPELGTNPSIYYCSPKPKRGL